MTKYNEENERAKRDYCRLLKHQRGKSDATIDAVRKAIRRYEDYTRCKSFTSFNREQVIGFKEHLSRQLNEQTGKPLSKATLLSIYNNLRALFEWLSIHPDYRRKIDITAIGYLTLSENDKRTAKAAKPVKFPSLEQIFAVVMSMPSDTDIEKRNQALVALTILTGVRVNALISLKLQHIDLANKHVSQDPNQVRTKFGKRIDTFFFPVGDDIELIVIDWVHYLQKEKLYGYDAPLFPRTQMAQDENDGFVSVGIEPEHWQSTDPVRRIFREAFEGAGLPYYHPHTFRHTLGHLALSMNLTGEALKAWSQNLGHEHIATTITSYGTLSPQRQGEMLKNLADNQAQETDLKALLMQAAAKL